MERILIVSGTRPEVIKLAPVYHALRQSGWADVRWLHTGQHGDVAAHVMACFEIVPDITLNRAGHTLTDFSIGCQQQLEPHLAGRPWSTVVVQGSTESAFQGALGAFRHRIPVAHVEAGLRTYDLGRPFPEEGLRQMISRVAAYHFAPTARARKTLREEAIAADRIWVTGNTVVDAQRWVQHTRGVERRTAGRGHLLVTVHRREHWGRDVEEICHAIADIAAMYPGIDVLFPVHPNPVIQAPVHAILGGSPNVRLAAPLSYQEMQQALADAWLVLTDSGGLQEEAPTYRVPVLVLRHETERPEAVEAGGASLVGTTRNVIVNEVTRLWHGDHAYQRMRAAGLPFGDGHAARRIATVLERALVKPGASRRLAA